MRQILLKYKNLNLYGFVCTSSKVVEFALIYINALITAGVAVSKKERYKAHVEYKPTGKLLKLWWAKQKSMKKKAIAGKIAEKTHTPRKEILKDTLPYLQIAFKKNKDFREKLTDELDLSQEEVEWMVK